MPLPYTHPSVIQHSRLLADNFQRLLKRPLIQAESIENLAEKLYHAPFVLVSHGTEADPIFNYGNLAAQHLWKMDWETITRLPSRFSAEPVAREERQRLLERVTRDGYIDDYAGVRIASDGTRFKIKDTVVWNLQDDAGCYIGQAATFQHWEPLT